MHEYLSPSAHRALQAASLRAARAGCARIEPVHVLLAVAEQEESRGAQLLAAHGLQALSLEAALCRVETAEPELSEPSIPPSESVRRILSNLRGRTLGRGADNPAGTDLLLLELLTCIPDLHELLGRHGADIAAITQELREFAAADTQPLPAEIGSLELPDPTQTIDVYRILDASANRAREGLRVLEDYTRFAWNDPWLTQELKSLRHSLQQAMDRLPRHELLEARDTQHDVGTCINTGTEWSRTHALDVLAANFKRTEEALRSLAEFGKLECRPLAEAAETARYRLYTLERAALRGADSRLRLDGVVLYVIVSSDSCRGSIEWTVREAVAGGAQVIQLREKQLADRELLELARRVRGWISESAALFIMNDRPDLARLAEADGVHLGQTELSVQDARRILGSRKLVGVSTHSIEQARQAVLDGADYIGVGPTFPSRTKRFQEFPGPALIRQVQAEIRLPAFAIGGIEWDRLDELLAAGGRRIAVSAAVCRSDSPREAASALRQRLAAPGQAGQAQAENTP
jgi:thiamine-phosphate pyrophosphorylase